jgi:AraC-like DNA-binding protein
VIPGSASADSSQSIAMVLETSDYLRLLDADQLNLFNQKFQNSLIKTVHHDQGTLLQANDASCRAVFPNATSAIFAAHKIHDDFKYVTPRIIKNTRRLHLVLAPVPNGFDVSVPSSSFFEELTRLCEYLRFDFVITREVRKAYRRENSHAVIDEDLIYVLSEREQKFFRDLMVYVRGKWAEPGIDRKEMAKATGYSVSQCNRNVKRLTGMSPQAFLKSYRLRKALKSIHDTRGRIGEVAVAHGFKNSTHFTRSFRESFGVLPSKYAQRSG